MRLRVLAVGNKMPAWVDEGVSEYVKRMPREVNVEWLEVPMAKRGTASVTRYQEQEAEAIRARLQEGEHLVVLHVAGKPVSTEAIAARFERWQMQGQRVSLVIGGPDGLHESLLHEATEQWSLGQITLPHPLVRVILAEQFYRAWSLLAGHPYHRAN